MNIIIFRVSVCAAIFFLVAGIYCWVTSMQEETYCGVIKYKIDAMRVSKYSVNADPIFVIDFKDRIQEVRPSWNDFMEYKEGDNICYPLKRPNAIKRFVTGAFFLMGVLITTITALVYSQYIDND